MGAINCCVDASAVDPCAQTCHATLPSLPVSADPVSIESIPSWCTHLKPNQSYSGEDHTCSSSDSSTSRRELQSAPHHTDPATPRTNPKRLPKKSKSTRPLHSYSLYEAPHKRGARLADYLCPCDPCPHSQRIDRLLDAGYREKSLVDEELTDPMRDALHRVLRGFATFDERKELDEVIISQVKVLLKDLHGDEDLVFRHMIAHKYQQAPVSTRRGSAVTA